MTPVSYKNFYITVRVVRQAGRYSVFTEIRSREDDVQPLRSFFASDQTEDAAYNTGIEQAKRWIDAQPAGD